MDLRVELDEPLLRFETGTYIRGNVVILNKGLKIQHFKKPLAISFIGKAWIWATASVEIFYTHKIFLLPPFTQDLNSKIREICPGKTVHPFEFRLPGNLPSSYKGKYGRVEYYADVTLIRVALPDRRVTMPFNVISTYDLNQDLDAMKSCKILIQKYVCCFCCRNGQIRVIFNVPRKGCVPGGFLQFNAQILNRSSVDLQRATVSLVQEANVCASKTVESETKVVCRMKGPSVRAGETKRWKVENFPVPIQSIPPTNLRPYGCLHYVTVSYTLKITVKASAFVSCLQDAHLGGTVPIIVGTIPLSSPDGEEDEESTTVTTGTRGIEEEGFFDEDEIYLPVSTARRIQSRMKKSSSADYGTGNSAPPSYIQLDDLSTPPPTYLEATIAGTLTTGNRKNGSCSRSSVL